MEWLGEVPEGWEIKRLKYLVLRPLQYGANEAAFLVDTDFPRFIRITDIHEDGSLRDDTFKSIPEEIAWPYLLSMGDFLFARSGATVGKTFRYEKSWGRAAFAGYLIRAKLNEEKVISSFVNYYTQSNNYWDWIRSQIIQATIQNVSAEKYANLWLPVPHLHEQRSIAIFLDCEINKLNALMERINNAIENLKEYRTALISAAVTGKIDVREEV